MILSIVFQRQRYGNSAKLVLHKFRRELSKTENVIVWSEKVAAHRWCRSTHAVLAASLLQDFLDLFFRCFGQQSGEMLLHVVIRLFWSS